MFPASSIGLALGTPRLSCCAAVSDTCKRYQKCISRAFSLLLGSVATAQNCHKTLLSPNLFTGQGNETRGNFSDLPYCTATQAAKHTHTQKKNPLFSPARVLVSCSVMQGTGQLSSALPSLEGSQLVYFTQSLSVVCLLRLVTPPSLYLCLRDVSSGGVRREAVLGAPQR